MFGAFRPSPITSVGLLWKMPYRLSKTRKFRQRLRLKTVDSVVNTLAATSSSSPIATLSQALELPTEQDMPPRDKYTTFSRKETGYRKGIHKVPHWTKITSRTNPHGF
ncbi:mitochondrial 54S ribosomal protein mL60 MRPL31 [Sporobolomyces koalae]|uniref:mitochondrial 54S ribosomal protein mL60 MRPL31 n=1 Tax=Sporobolomyces koalae TaxID=500713 RepID=UPI00317E3D89